MRTRTYSRSLNFSDGGADRNRSGITVGLDHMES